MEYNPLLVENENKRLDLPLPYLVCFAMFAAWQFTMVYFSGQTFSVDGRTPVPVDVDNVTLIIVAGYIVSILVMIFKPEIIVWTSRVTGIVLLLATIALFLPLPPEVIAMILYVQYFCCFILTGFESGIAIGLFTVRSAILWLSVGYGIAHIHVALFHNDFFIIEFSLFRVFALVALVMMLIFFFKLPGKSWPRSVKKSDKLAVPKGLYAGVLLWSALGGLLLLFGTPVAEGTEHGVFVYYLAVTATCFAIYPLWKWFQSSPFRTFKIFTAMGAVGFILAIASLFVPSLSLIAVAALGIGSVCCCLNPLFGLMLSRQYPSRFIAPAIICIAIIGVLIHISLLEAFRDNLLVLYLVYLVVAVTLVIVYLLLEPYLSYSFRGRTMQDLIGIVAEDDENDKTANKDEPDIMPVKRAPLLVEKGGVKPVTPEEISLHERRMKNLVKHSLDPLTKREYQVADYIMRGLRRAEIAKELDLLPETITKYTSRIYDKFSIHSRKELFQLAETLEREQ